MKIIEINSPKNGIYKMLVDDSDYEMVSEYTWRLVTNKYGFSAATNIWVGTNKYKSIAAHRLIMRCPKERCIDHIDGNALNNQKSNLRVCSIAENNKNMRIGKRNKSGFKGVWYDPEVRKFRASIGVNGKTKYLSYYPTAIDAAKAYNNAALIHYGEFAKLNPIND